MSVWSRFAQRGNFQRNHTVSGTALALAVVTVVITNKERLVHVDRVGDGLAEAVSGERHDDC